VKGRPILYLSFLVAVVLTAMAWQGFPRLRRQPSPSASLKHGLRDAAPQGSPVSAQSRPGLVPDARSEARFATNLLRTPLTFEANQGQTDERIKFLSRGRGFTLFLAGNQALLALRKNAALYGGADLRGPWSSAKMRNSVSTDREKFEPPILLSAGRDPVPLRGLEKPQGRVPRPVLHERPENPSVLRMELVGANPRAMAAGLDPLPGKSNYFIGNDPKKWRTNVPNYAKVKYRDVYPGVDLVYYGNQGQLEYDFVVRPGADPRAIKMIVGAGLLPSRGDLKGSPLQIDTNGDLVFGTGGEFRFHKPLVYQPVANGVRLPVDAHYSLEKDEVSFELARYDRNHPLVIDPVLSYSTYLGSSDLLGGSNLDTGWGIAVDSAGNAYVTGPTNSADFPTLNPFQATSGSGTDVFITKLNPTGSALVYSTYLGGSGNDRGAGIAVDSSGNAYVTGVTGSTNFPTLNPFQATSGGGDDAFVTNLTPTGNAPVYSTYLGGSGNEIAAGIAVDPSGNAYFTGPTDSTNFPTLNPFQATSGGGKDVFVTKLNAAGSGLVYSTYLGGSGDDLGTSVIVDSSGNAYVTGFTGSTNFPTLNPFQPTSGGGNDAFVSKLNPTGNALVYSTYLGGSANDGGGGIAVDSSGNAYVTGSTASLDFPTFNALQGSLSGNFDTFVAKLDPAGTALVYSTHFGSYDIGNAIATDSSGNAYVTGWVQYPGGINASIAVEGCGFGIITLFDAFVTELKPDGTGPVFSTCLGGAPNTAGFAIALDSSGSAYVTGCTDSAIFTTTSQAFQRAGGGGDCVVYDAGDAFVSKISPVNATVVSLVPAALNFSTKVVGAPSTGLQDFFLLNVGNLPLTINSISITGTNSGDFAIQPYGYSSVIATPLTLNGGGSLRAGIIFTPTAPGARTATVTVTDDAPDSPQTIALSGTGTTAAAATLSSTALNFGSEILGTKSAPQMVMVTNSGSANLTVSTVSMTGTNASDFTMQSDSCTAATVAPGSTCSVALVFKPSLSGIETVTVNIADNAWPSPQAAVLTGTGQDFSVSSNPASATITAGQSTTFTLSVAPVGGFNQAVNLSCSVATAVSQAPACSVSPTSLTPSGSAVATATMTVTTTARGLVVPNDHLPLLPYVPLGVWIVMGAALMLSVATARRLGLLSGLKTAPAALLLACLLLAAIWTGCGGGGSSSGPPPPTGTPAGNYTLTVTGNSQGVSRTANLTLTVN